MASTTCYACAANTYTVDGIKCKDCPQGSFSPPGSGALTSCTCPFNSYPLVPAVPTATSPAFTCEPCPEGAYCSGASAPLARDGWWHSPDFPDSFYDCEPGRCLKEQPFATAASPPPPPPSTAALSKMPTPLPPPPSGRSLLQVASNGISGATFVNLSMADVSNCRIGHTGPVCAVCENGYTYQGTFCKPCRPSSAYKNWRVGTLTGFLLALFLLFLGVSLPYLWMPIVYDHPQVQKLLSYGQENLQRAKSQVRYVAKAAAGGFADQGEQEEESGAPSGRTARMMATFTYLGKVAGIVGTPAKMLVDNLQARH